MGDHKRLKDMRPLHPQNLEELGRVPLYYPFEWNGKKMRVVPADDDKWANPCKCCKFIQQRNISLCCPMSKACMGKFRVDGRSVKFIGDELSSLNNWDEVKREAEKADREAKLRIHN